MKPYIVAEERSPDLKLLSKPQPQTLHQAMSARAADELTQMMVSVVQDGHRDPGQIPGISVAAKTGTANSAPNRPPYAWFVGFAPADNPQVAVAVLVEQSGDQPRRDRRGHAGRADRGQDVIKAVVG